MVSSSRSLQRLSLGRWLLGLMLVMANGCGWACADHVADAGQHIKRLAERPAAAQVPDRAVPDAVAHGTVLRGRAVPGAAPADHPCNHAKASGGAVPSREPCTLPGSPCSGLCATVCLPAAGAGPMLPYTPAGLQATGLTEVCPQRSGWTGTGRSVPPESPPPIV